MVKTAKEIGVSDVALRKAAKGEKLRAATADKIAAYYKKSTAEMFDTLPMEKSLAASNVHSVLTALSSIFQSAYKAGIMKENPIRRTTPPRPSKATDAVFLDEEQERRFLAILDAMPQGTYRAAFFVLLYVGLRSGELRALHWSDIDFERGIIYIRHGLYADGGRVPDHADVDVADRQYGERDWVRIHWGQCGNEHRAWRRGYVWRAQPDGYAVKGWHRPAQPRHGPQPLHIKPFACCVRPFAPDGQP